MVVVSCLRAWSFIFLAGTVVHFSHTTAEDMYEQREKRGLVAEDNRRRLLDSYYAVVAGMSCLTIMHGLWKSEYVETAIGFIGLVVSLGSVYWPESDVQQIPSKWIEQKT